MLQPRYDALKRVMDVLVAGALLAVTSPLQLVVAALVRRHMGSPVLFRQARPGRDEVIFELVKFRTMAPRDPERGLETDEQRLGRFGSVLRATSLDELPTLWNVLAGDMSLVGPRPLLVQYLERYSACQRRRHEVRPGMTGLAQVHGRNEVAWADRLRLDVEYVENRSLRLDLSILAKTVALVLRRQGVSGAGTVTMHEFVGNTDERGVVP